MDSFKGNCERTYFPFISLLLDCQSFFLRKWTNFFGEIFFSVEWDKDDHRR